MRQTNAAGERLFVDYAGDGVLVVVDRLTGESGTRKSSSLYWARRAHASWTQALPDWIDAHVRALEAIGGVPHLLVPDRPRSSRPVSTIPGPTAPMPRWRRIRYHHPASAAETVSRQGNSFILHLVLIWAR
jgi:hypothetical protein